MKFSRSWLGLLGLMFSLLSGAPRLLGQAGGGDWMTIDAVEVEGQTASSVSLLRSILDIPLGIALPRPLLEQHLAEARLRVMALGYYRDVWLRLNKGRERGHYRLVVLGEAFASTYYGAGLSAQSNNQDSIFRASSSHFVSGSVFLGDRNWHGLWLDGQIDSGEGWISEGSGVERYNGNVKVSDVILNAFEPDLDEGRFLVGLRLQTVYADTSVFYSPINARLIDRQLLSSAIAQAGVRYGLATMSAVWSGNSVHVLRGTVPSFSEADWGVKTTYSEKSYLALVEPGLDAQVDALQATGTERERKLNLSLLYTWMPSEGWGTTPGLRRTDRWPSYGYLQENELYLHLDWVTAANWVVSAEPRWEEQGWHPGVWHNGLTVTARYVTSSSLYSLSLILGAQSLEGDLIPGPREQLR